MFAPTPALPRLLKRPVSDAQRAAARRNGAKSRGPATARGKRASSANARTHGLYAQPHNLTPAEQLDYDKRRRAYVEALSPACPLQAELLDTMALAQTRLESLARHEALLWHDTPNHNLLSTKEFRALLAAHSRALTRFQQAHDLFLSTSPERTQECVENKRESSRSAARNWLSQANFPPVNILVV